MDNVIETKHLKKTYGNIKAINDISFRVEKGEIFGLLGANGAGKSTTIECMLGTRKPDSGSAAIIGMEARKDRKKLFQRVGVQFQESGYQENITVKELCELTASLYKSTRDYYELLSQFGLYERQKSLVSELSGGLKQKLFIILALIPEPEVVFLDELTTGLDARARREVWNILEAMKQKGLTIMLTSHYMDEVEKLCDRIAILKQGRIIFCGTVAEAIEASPYEKLEDAYLWYADEEVESYENI